MSLNPTRDETIARRYRVGEAITLLASEYGLSRQRIFQIVERNGDLRPRIKIPLKEGSQRWRRRQRAAGLIPPRERKPSPISTRIVEMRAAGFSYNAIADACEVSVSSIQFALKWWAPDLMGWKPQNKSFIRVK